jgi:CHASE3 domain sensor protein
VAETIDEYDQFVDEAEKYSIDFTDKTAILDTTVSSVAWAVQEGTATIANEALTSDIAEAWITTPTAGCVLIKATATMADSKTTDIKYFKITVAQPAC